MSASVEPLEGTLPCNLPRNATGLECGRTESIDAEQVSAPEICDHVSLAAQESNDVRSNALTADLPQNAHQPPQSENSYANSREICAEARSYLSKREWFELFILALFVLAINVIGWFVLIVLVVSHHYRFGKDQGIFGIGLGITAYTLGLRHAFDADHIAAIDNTTRKLMEEGRRPLSVGFWFSLGHSTVVFLASVLIT